MSDDPHKHHHSHSHVHSHGTPLSRRRLLKGAATFTPVALVGSSGTDPLLAKNTNGIPLGILGQPRSESEIWKELRTRAANMPIYDTHEHLWHEDIRLKKAIDLFLLFSHYTSSDLVTAGMAPEEVKSLQNPEIPLENRWKMFSPYWSYTRTTGYGRCMLIAARDLFGIDDIHKGTYKTLSERITAANQAGWYHTVLKDKANIEISIQDDLISTSGQKLKLDKRFFKTVTRFDYLVTAKDKSDLGHVEKVTGISISNLADLELALEKAFADRLQEGMVGVKSGLAYRRPIHYQNVPRSEANRAFEHVFASSSHGDPDPFTKRKLEDYMMHRVIRQVAEHQLPMQIHTGLQAGNRNHVAWTKPSHLSELLNEYQQVPFDLFHGGYPYGGELAAISKNLPNVYPDLCWLHIIAPGVAKRTLHELIETVPGNKILGYGGDFFHVEGAYAHAQMARALTAEVLAEKVENGYLREEEAFYLLDRILYRNGRELFGKG